MPMKRSVKVVLVLLVALSVVLGIGAAVSASVQIEPIIIDAGGFSGDNDFSYDPGGDSGGGWSGGDSDWSDSGGGGGSGEMSLPGAIISLIIIVIIIVMSKRQGKKAKQSRTMPTTVRMISAEQSAAVANQVRAIDPFFTEALMREKVANLYVEMQEAWESQDWAPMRARMTNDLYNQMGRQLQELINRGLINRIDNIAVMNVALSHFYQDDQHDILTIRLSTRITDYTVERATGKVVSGDPNREKFMTYDWNMIRSRGVQTPPPDQSGKTEVSRNCPHCGAPIDLAQSARCSYCHSLVTAPEFDWVLSTVQGVAQQTM
jgi:hypothetical protein